MVCRPQPTPPFRFPIMRAGSLPAMFPNPVLSIAGQPSWSPAWVDGGASRVSASSRGGPFVRSEGPLLRPGVHGDGRRTVHGRRAGGSAVPPDRGCLFWRVLRHQRPTPFHCDPPLYFWYSIIPRPQRCCPFVWVEQYRVGFVAQLGGAGWKNGGCGGRARFRKP